METYIIGSLRDAAEGHGHGIAVGDLLNSLAVIYRAHLAVHFPCRLAHYDVIACCICAAGPGNGQGVSFEFRAY